MMFVEELYLGMVYVECIQQYVFRTSSGMSFVWTQSMGFPTYLKLLSGLIWTLDNSDSKVKIGAHCRVVTMREKARRKVTVAE